MSKRVIAAMSGGVDSSVMAALMIDAGYDVIAVTMRLGNHDTVEYDSEKPNCCSLEGVEDARYAAMQLGIPFYAVNHEDQFRQSIVDYFVDEYTVGRTPSPCVICNQELKFGTLVDLADQLDCEYIGTGHYAKIEQDPETGRYLLRKGSDFKKDQSYFLFSLTQSQLKRAIMPLGSLNKEAVRDIARRYKLKTAEKPESQELCFIADDDYKRFLKDRIPEQIQKGEIVDQNGEKLGHHKGIPFYTVGQRRGLGIAVGEPIYVTGIKTETNTIVVGQADELLRQSMIVNQLNWIPFENLAEPIRAQIKIRYRDQGEMATVTPTVDGKVKVIFDQPRRAIAPGQAAVFYAQDLVIGGGWIET
ncbi:tRNA 2-thiouridine(34) synthase MnmA [Candidatus Poribacteria bacterium]|nr:tRNA 2-thiouridine(34) synthase MnmA [Candidatus Poribacteria bacterium]MDP6961200.1 tRNA 2-thiouridine(34) synthase MnmA [Dehalococcoidia bacterium]